jgi:CHASE3 domain sensor protein
MTSNKKTSTRATIHSKQQQQRTPANNNIRSRFGSKLCRRIVFI